MVGCSRCGVRAEAQDRMPIDIRDLSASVTRPGWLDQAPVACVDADCDAKT